MDIRIDDAINWLVENQGLVIPYNLLPGSYPGGIHDLDSKILWDAYQWNPPQYQTEKYPDPDPDASPKPTWDELVEAYRKAKLADGKRRNDYFISGVEIRGYDAYYPDEIKAELTDAASVKVGDEGVHIGAGLSHMTGLLQMVEHANEAGANIPYIIMRDADNKRKSIHLQSDVRNILEAAAARENIVESAHNVVISLYAVQARIRDDESNTLDAREEAAEKANDFVVRYKTHLETQISNYNPDVLPAGLEAQKSVYAERLEAVATGKQKSLKDALTQQAIDNWATCVDMNKGMTEIAVSHRLGYIEIMRATTEGEAKTAFDTATTAINEVKILNVAGWLMNNVSYVDGDSVEVTSRSITLSCIQADDVAGNVSILYPKVTDGNGKISNPILFTRVPIANTKDQNAVIVLHPVDPLPITVNVRGINLCGPSELTIKVVAATT